MKWRDMTIGKRIGTGFGIVLVLLIAVGLLAYTGTRGIVGNAEEVIDGNRLDGTLAQKEVDHLNWVNQVNALLTDDTITTLTVETDCEKCGFGKWLYGEGRKEAEALVPSLAPLFKEIEAPHRALHESAAAIGKVFKQANPQLPVLLTEREADHLKWASAIRDAFIQKRDTLGVQTDPTQCALGRWLKSKEAKTAYEQGDSDFKSIWDKMLVTHKGLHESAKEIEPLLMFREMEMLSNEKNDLYHLFEELSKTLFQILDQAMADVVDPAKDRAQTAGDMAALGFWGEVDMVMNEKVIQPFLKARVAMADYEQDKTAALWQSYLTQIEIAVKGVEEWGGLVADEKQLAPAMARLNTLVGSWEEKSQAFHRAVTEEIRANASIAGAMDLYNQKTIPLLNQTVASLNRLKKEAEHELAGMGESSRIYAAQTVPALGEVQALLQKIRKQARAGIMTDEAMLRSAQRTNFTVIILVCAASVIGMFLAFFIARGIIRVLARISGGLGEGAGQVAQAAAQVSDSSQSMAEGASQQAASIEETSSSMEEMSSMTRKNAENAGHADSLMTEANGVVKTAHSAMARLTESMDDISRASEETSKIIKTIDEIAFQTNLLALNAAVEAARAGEAGAGFAVVADEVRNLAMRAAEAARDTAELIESTVKKVEGGSQLVASTNEAFTRVAESTAKVGELVAEISEASREQSDGIDQVNKAISEMDKVVQSNAANAEESASASEELNAQAEQLRDYVEDLVKMVTGEKRASQMHPTGPVTSIAAKPRQQAVPAMGRQEVRPDQVIPFDADDEAFKDF